MPIKLSPSRISLYISCPMKYFFKYIKKLLIVPNVNLFSGSMVHKMAELDYKNKLLNKQLLNLDSLKKNFKEYWNKGQTDREEKTTATIEEILKTSTSTEESVKKMIIGCVFSYRNKIAQFVEPAYVEQELTYEENNILMTCYTDIIDEDESIRDIKTSKEFYKEDEINKSIALPIYNHGYYKKFGRYPKYNVLDIIIKNSEKTQILTKKVEQKDIDFALNNAIIIARAISNGIFYRREVKKGDWTCNYCDYKIQCANWNGNLDYK